EAHQRGRQAVAEERAVLVGASRRRRRLLRGGGRGLRGRLTASARENRNEKRRQSNGSHAVQPMMAAPHELGNPGAPRALHPRKARQSRRPQRDSNPRWWREKPLSWASRRWGPRQRALLPLQPAPVKDVLVQHRRRDGRTALLVVARNRCSM